MRSVGPFDAPEIRLLVDGLTDHMVCLLDPAGRIASWNAGAERLTGFRAGEVVDLPLAQLYGAEPAERAAADEDLAHASAFGRSERRGFRRRKDGARYFAHAVLAALREDDGRLRGFLELVRDLTERRTAEEVRQERERLRAILEQLPVGVVIAEAPAGRILLANQASEEIMGMRPTPSCELADAPWRMLRLDGTPLETEELALARALMRGEQVRREEAIIERNDGTRRRLRMNAGPIFERSGEEGERIVAAVVAFVDVTHEMEAREVAARTDRYRELLVGMLGHDLRSPLGAILMGVELLERRGLAGPHRALVARIRSSAQRMLRMIEQVLDLTRARLGGGIPIRRATVELTTLCRRVIEELELAHPDREVRLDAPPSVQGEWDGERLERVLANLIGNAFAHGDPARPIEVALRDRGDQVELLVENEGPTIPPELLATLFDPFHRAEPHDDRGLGLGLYIAQQILAAHGGTIEVTSTAGRTRVTARLPR